jgi:hypothetical protein
MWSSFAESWCPPMWLQTDRLAKNAFGHCFNEAMLLKNRSVWEFGDGRHPMNSWRVLERSQALASRTQILIAALLLGLTASQGAAADGVPVLTGSSGSQRKSSPDVSCPPRPSRVDPYGSFRTRRVVVASPTMGPGECPIRIASALPKAAQEVRSSCSLRTAIRSRSSR